MALLQRLLLINLCACLLCQCSAFYLPGVAPVEYKRGEELEIKAVKMTSVKTQLPYDYYSLPFCKPAKGIHYKSENLGEVLRGDRIVSTPYKVHVLKDEKCHALCFSGGPLKFNPHQSSSFHNRISKDYAIHMLLDNLPVATKIPSVDDPAIVQFDDGFRLGFMHDGKAYVNNHLDFTIRYHQEGETSDDGVRIVGFEVNARSIQYDSMKSETECTIPEMTKSKPLLIEKEKESQVWFTFGVQWVHSKIRWASRWDIFLDMSDVQIHWFSIINSLVIVLFLSGILAMIMIRTLRKDIAKYNREEDMDEAMEETGWKLVHGDIFRPPQHSLSLTVLIGSGMHIFMMTLVVLVLAMFGMLSPASRGALMSASIVLYAFMGIFSGYYAGRLYKTLKGTQWKRAAIVTGSMFPCAVFGVCFILNFFIWGKKSSGAVPFTTMLALLFMFLGICMPLVTVGFYFGFRKQGYDHPVRTNQIPRQVPDQPWYMHLSIGVLTSGVLPFGAVFIELFFIFSAIWQNQFYYLFGILFLVFIILIICCSEITIVLIYFQLCGENYHWWWRSFFLSGGSALYVLIYSIFYFHSKLEITEFIPALLYFSYSGLIILTFWLLTGTIGFWATYYFIGRIYSEVKID
ncbi:transmembrane 9 superfamily member 4-like [Corticium candelabrum]|uniref:transmembrane 9 superfamily member 4-like n=1 Tax=Corticium candelabrum TaxID=121492 RepID=UPI002E26EA36|nr:transmembrane 9 superfamily member 4-like [Corticium candelabrum]